MFTTAFFNTYSIIAGILAILTYVIMLVGLHLNWKERLLQTLCIICAIGAIVFAILGAIHFFQFMDTHISIS